MEAKIILVNCLVFLVLSCNTKTKLDNRIQNQWYLGLKDTMLIESSGNSFIKYHLQGDTIYSIEWGNKLINNKSNAKFEVLGNGVLGKLEEDEETIVLNQGCGSSCQYYVFLPIKHNETEKVYNYTKAYDLKRKLVVFIPDGNDIFLRVENYITKQTMDIKESNICPAGFKGDCIDSIYFSKNNLVIKWQGDKWKNTSPDPQEKTIPIKFK